VGHTCPATVRTQKKNNRKKHEGNRRQIEGLFPDVLTSETFASGDALFSAQFAGK
jgi:hypothetical protein